MDAFTARIAERMERSKARAERVRAAVPELARELAKRGATRVVLVGSLARADVYNEDTDVDLIVWGLAMGDAYEAGCDLSKLVDARMGVIPEDIIGPRLRNAIATEGVDVTVDHVAAPPSLAPRYRQRWHGRLELTAERVCASSQERESRYHR
jgi:predicted nucleotidyltransferase